MSGAFGERSLPAGDCPHWHLSLDGVMSMAWPSDPQGGGCQIHQELIAHVLQWWVWDIEGKSKWSFRKVRYKINDHLEWYLARR